MRRIADPTCVEFAPEEATAVIRCMDMAATKHAGWVNARPIIRRQDEPPPPGIFSIFGGSPHKVPTATWVPGAVGRDGQVKRPTIGLQHSRGPRVVRQLRELGLPLPSSWKVTQDHPRRGLVAEVPTSESNSLILHWLVDAGTALCDVPATGLWRADIFA